MFQLKPNLQQNFQPFRFQQQLEQIPQWQPNNNFPIRKHPYFNQSATKRNTPNQNQHNVQESMDTSSGNTVMQPPRTLMSQKLF